MNKSLPLILWSLVIVAAAIIGLNLMLGRGSDTGVMVPISEHGDSSQPGAAFANVPWEHMQNVPPFQLTNQNGEEFDSAEIAGRPMTISFFFATCPTICRDLNKQIRELRTELNDPEMMFVTLSVDPDNDTPEVLEKYALDFGATTQDWNFLTGPLYKVKQLGSQTFRVSVDRDTHTDNILLVDRWGRYRDRFKWNDPYDMKRYLQVARDVLAEQEPPLGKSFATRNVLAGVNPPDLNVVPWVHDFHLTDQDSQPFYSRDLGGQVWVASFFFVSCPGICVEQNQYLAGLQSRLSQHPASIVSITTDSRSDTPDKLKTYGRKMGADFSSWKFLTGDETLIERAGAEYFGAHASGGHHSTLLFVVDRWANVRGEFDWREPAAELRLLELIDELNAETVPPARFERVSVRKEAVQDKTKGGH